MESLERYYRQALNKVYKGLMDRYLGDKKEWENPTSAFSQIYLVFNDEMRGLSQKIDTSYYGKSKMLKDRKRSKTFAECLKETINTEDQDILMKKFEDTATTEAYLEFIKFLDEERNRIEKTERLPEEGKSKEYTRARQVLAIYFLLDSFGINTHNTDKTTIARFCHLLAGEDFTKQPSDSYIYKKVKNLFSKSEKKNTQDLRFVFAKYEDLGSDNPGIRRILDLIRKDISNKE